MKPERLAAAHPWIGERIAKFPKDYKVVDILHIRVALPQDVYNPKTRRWENAFATFPKGYKSRSPLRFRHIAMTIVDDGTDHYKCFIGVASCHYKDVYIKSKGFKAAVGQSLSRAAGLIRLNNPDYLLHRDDPKLIDTALAKLNSSPFATNYFSISEADYTFVKEKFRNLDMKEALHN